MKPPINKNIEQEQLIHQLQQHIHQLVEWINSFRQQEKPYIPENEELRSIDDHTEGCFLIAEYNLLKYYIITNENEGQDDWGTEKELEDLISQYYLKLEQEYSIPTTGDLFSRRKAIIQKLYKVDLDAYLFEEIELSINSLREYNREILKKHEESQELLLKAQDQAVNSNILGGMSSVYKKDLERYELIDSKVSPLIYKSYENLYHHENLPPYLLLTHALFSYRSLKKEPEIFRELNTVFSKLYTFMRYAGVQNQSEFFGDEDIPQKLALKHLGFLSAKYEYQLFPYTPDKKEFIKQLSSDFSGNAINFKKYRELFGQLVLCREHLFYPMEEKLFKFDNYDSQISYHKLLEMPGLVMHDIVPMDKEAFLEEIEGIQKFNKFISIEAYRNEYLYLHGKFSLLINKLIQNDKTYSNPKYALLSCVHSLLTKNVKAYPRSDIVYNFPNIFHELLGFLKSHPEMSSFYGALYLLMQKMSIDELQDIFPKELSPSQKEIYSDWRDNMVNCIEEFENTEHPDLLDYFGVKNYVKEKYEAMGQKCIEQDMNFIHWDMVTGKVITNPDDYDHGYKGFFDYNLKNNFTKAREELEAYDRNDEPKTNKDTLSKLLYHALWDTVSREIPKDIRDGRWNELLEQQISSNQWGGAFAEFRYDSLPNILNWVTTGYQFNKDKVFNQNLDNIPQHLIIRALYYMSRYQSNTKESMISYANMIREIQLETCDIKANKKNKEKLQQIDIGFEILDFDVQLYPFSTNAVNQYMLNSQDNKIITQKTIKLFCEVDTNEGGDYDYIKALNTRYLYNDRNVYIHDALSKHVRELLSSFRWKDLLEVLDEFRLKVLLPPLQKDLIYSARLGLVRSHGGKIPTVVFVLHVDRTVKNLMRNVMEFVNKELETDIPIEFPSSAMKKSYTKKFIARVEPHFEGYKKLLKEHYKKDIIDSLKESGASEELAEKIYKKDKKTYKEKSDQQVYKRMSQYPPKIKEELEMLLNAVLSTHTTNEYGREKNTTNYDIWIQHRPQILLYFVSVLQQLSEFPNEESQKE